jgi:hypothetical protein
MLKWEPIVETDNYQYTERLKVHKGWIVRCRDSVKNNLSSVFVPDEKHEWKIEE